MSPTFHLYAGGSGSRIYIITVAQLGTYDIFNGQIILAHFTLAKMRYAHTASDT